MIRIYKALVKLVIWAGIYKALGLCPNSQCCQVWGIFPQFWVENGGFLKNQISRGIEGKLDEMGQRSHFTRISQTHVGNYNNFLKTFWNYHQTDVSATC